MTTYAPPEIPFARTENIRVAIGESSLGVVLVARTATGLAAILLGDDELELRRDIEKRFPLAMVERDDTNAMTELVARVVKLIESPADGLNEPLDLRGTDFQRSVWEALRSIPAGSTASYKDIANQIGLPKSMRAVAQACGANPAAVVVPCHRVVRSDGGLSGYRWGVERKRALLDREARVTV